MIPVHTQIKTTEIFNATRHYQIFTSDKVVLFLYANIQSVKANYKGSGFLLHILKK